MMNIKAYISNMICIITGDIIGSRKIKDSWLSDLKTALKVVSDHSGKWEIYRGDSFQLEVGPENAIKTAAYLKACIKVNKPADVRMGIGIGAIKTKRKNSLKVEIRLSILKRLIAYLKHNLTTLNLLNINCYFSFLVKNIPSYSYN